MIFDQKAKEVSEADWHRESFELFKLLEPTKGTDTRFIWRAAWLAVAFPETRTQIIDAANGPRTVKANVSNPVGYFRKCLSSAFGTETFKQMLKRTPPPRRCPDQDPRDRQTSSIVQDTAAKFRRSTDDQES